MSDPWGKLQDLERDGWRVTWAPSLRSLGLCRWSTRTILLRNDLTQVQVRCVLTHELVHALRGPVPRRMLAREETTVRRAAALLLVELQPLIDAVAWSTHPVVVAAELDVDLPTLEARAEALTEGERAAIAERIEHIHLP